jgi:3-hydroxybutyryl-CoA dehydrogenase
MQIKMVGICGCGQMGSGIAEVAAKAGFNVIAREVNDDLLKKGLGRIETSLSRAVEKGKLEAAAKADILSRVKGTTRLDDLRDCDLVCEAIVENTDEKVKLYRDLDRIVKKDAIFASNTSSISITEMGAATSRPAQFLGLHFFNPVPVMKLVEVIRTVATSDDTYQSAREFAEKVGTKVVTCKDRPGFIVNVLLVPYLLDAVRAYQDGVATREDIDTGMKLGCGHPMGPLELTDFIGLDTIYYIAEILFEEFKDHHYAAPPLLKTMVKAGMLGKKSGRGFYEYGKK